MYRAAIFSCKNLGPVLATSSEGVSYLGAHKGWDRADGGDGGDVELEDRIRSFHDRHCFKYVIIINRRHSAGIARE